MTSTTDEFSHWQHHWSRKKITSRSKDFARSPSSITYIHTRNHTVINPSMADSSLPIEEARRSVDRLGIDYNKLPQQPFWAPLTGRTNEEFKVLIAARIMSCSVMVGRVLTQPEKDALAQHYASLLRTRTFDSLIAMGATLGFYRYTYKSYGFPLYTPRPKTFDPTNFFGLKSALAPRAWHGIRFVAWYGACKIVASIFCLSYGLSVHTARFASDPRLADYRQLLQAKSGQQRLGSRQRETARARLRQEQAEYTGAQFPPEVQRRAAAPSSWGSTEQSTQNNQSEWPGMQSTQSGNSQSSYSDEPYVFDDASPLAPVEQQSDTVQQSAQGFSAWDRIRGQARSKAAPQGHVSGGQFSGGQANSWEKKRSDELAARVAQEGTSYTYSSADEEKAYAKAQAQREFDQMLERERRGGSDGSRRW